MLTEAAIQAALAVCVAQHPVAGEAPPRRIVAHARVESAMRPYSVGVNKDDRRGLPAESRAFPTEAEAVAFAWRKREQEKRSIDVGLMGINHTNWERMGLTYATMFKVEANVCAGARILGEAYVQVLNRRAGCVYNSGAEDCHRVSGTNGYPERVDRAANAPPQPARIPTREIPAAPPQPLPFDLFQRHRAPAPAAIPPAGDPGAPAALASATPLESR